MITWSLVPHLVALSRMLLFIPLLEIKWCIMKSSIVLSALKHE